MVRHFHTPRDKPSVLRPTRLTITAALLMAIAVMLSVGTGSAGAAGGQVVVPHGGPVQIAVVLDKSDSIGATYYAGIHNAIQMAVQLHPAIHGVPVKLNDAFDAPCLGDTAVAQNASAAGAVVANPQNVAVIGHMCSAAFAGTVAGDPCPSPANGSALSIYESNRVVVLNGSTTSACLGTIGPTVFNATIISDPGSDDWAGQVAALPGDKLWQLAYRAEFGVAPTGFADLYFDATRLLLARLDRTARVVNGHLVIDRLSLAQAVRHTRHFPGVTCSIALDPATGFRINDQAALARCAKPIH